MSGFRLISTLVIVSSVAAAVWIGRLQFEEAGRASVPMAPVRSGEFLAVIRTRGQIQAERSYPIYAPVAQDLRISWMAPSGELIEEGEPMLRFDSSTAERDLIERRRAVDEARANLAEAIVEAEVEAEHDAREMVDSGFSLELAELRTLDSEFVGRLEAEQSQIDLELAQQALRQLEAEIAQRRVSTESKIASLERRLADAESEVAVIQSRIGGMEIRAPTTGYAIYAVGSSSITSLLSGSARAPLRIGDEVSSGRTLGTIPDLTSTLIDVTVEEIDRGRIRVGDEVIVRVDALPEVSMRATLTGISPLAEMSTSTRTRAFHAYAALGSAADPRVRPGMNGSMDIVTERIDDARIIPALALFTRRGRPIVYVVDGEEFRATEVEVEARNSDEIAVRGLDADARVTLVDPFADTGMEEDEQSESGEGL